jgi:hypothetical protein
MLDSDQNKSIESHIMGEILAFSKNELLNTLSSEGASWKKPVLDFLISELETKGVDGLLSTKKFIEASLKGDFVDFTGVDLIIASEVLAQLQKQEEANKKVIVDYLTQIGEILGVILVSLLKSAVLK